MIKKIISFLLVLGFITPNFVHAYFLAPYINLTIIEQTTGGDGQFTFDFKQYGMMDSISNAITLDSATIQTQNGSGQVTLSEPASSGLVMNLVQNEIPGWSTPIISCKSASNLMRISQLGDGAVGAEVPYASITCTFENKKINSTRRPVLFVPGVLGTDILKDSNKLWLNLEKNLTDVGDKFMDPLQFDNNLQPIESNISIGDVVSKITAGVTLFNYSDGLVQEFRGKNYIPDNNLFLFPYDWRYGVSGKYANGSTTVDLLKQKIDEIRQQTGADKVDVVAHSTGGLLVKKYVFDHANDNHIGKAVFLGVPNTGAPKAIKVLLQGDNFNVLPLAESEMKKISENLPVVYDLAPSSEFYKNKGSFVKIINQGFFSSSNQDLNFDQTNSFLINDHNLNSQAISNSNSLHSSDFDNFDLRTAGVDLYSINGCKAGTISKIIERRSSTLVGKNLITYDTPEETPGDGTVPFESATNLPIDDSHKFYALSADHGKMPSQDGIKQQIVNIISGSQLSTQDSKSGKDLITQDITKCKLNGKAFSVYSPVDLVIVDQDGDQGEFRNGEVINNIPNADFEIMGEHKFVYLPTDDGQTYSVKLKGTGEGTFTFKASSVENNQVSKSEVFSNLPVTTQLTGSVVLGNDEKTSLAILVTPTSSPIIIEPSAILDEAKSQDLISPISTSTITGLMGDAGYYRSDVKIYLSAIDPFIPGIENQTSGVLGIKYSLDGSSYLDYSSTTPIKVTTEGAHAVKFFSTDRAGNNEQTQEADFVIDKTPPEFVMTFVPKLNDIVFSATDTWSTLVNSTSTPILKLKKQPKIIDQNNILTAVDAAGNTSILTLTDKDRRSSDHAQIKALTYNGTSVDISKLLLSFSWQVDKKQNLKELDQQARNKKNFNVQAEYENGKTAIEGFDQTGRIHENYQGLKLLQIITNKGDFNWNF